MRDHVHLSADRLAAAQGVFYVAAGLWPVFDRRSFENVTGPKTDFWLVRTVGLLIASTGLALTAAGARRSVDFDTGLLGAASASSLAMIDLVYGLPGRISRVYLLDAVVEGALAALWVSALVRRRLQDSERRELFERPPAAGL
jgi:ABC-type cobalamin transport system permease subunit